jgi:hypothetical protein
MKGRAANTSAKAEGLKVAQLLDCHLYQRQAQQAVADWNSLHDFCGSYADEHSTL